MSGTKSSAARRGAEARGIQSVQIACRILRAVEAAETGRLSLRDLAERAGMSPAKLRFYLVSFLREGLLVRDPLRGTYALGAFAIQLGLAGLRHADIVTAAQDVVAALRTDTGLTTILTVWGSRGPVIIAKLDGDLQSPLTVRVGSTLPLGGGATGQIYLSHMPPGATGPLLALERAGQPAADEASDAAALRALRDAGIAFSSGRYFQGFAGASAPVLAHDGSLAGALTLLGTDAVRPARWRGELAARLLEAARAISSRLGAPPRGNVPPGPSAGGP